MCSQVENDVSERVDNSGDRNEVELNDKVTPKQLKDGTNSLMKIHLSKSHKLDRYSWKAIPLFIDQKLPFGLKLYCVCDGHGLNGHIVSQYIKAHMISKFLITKERTLPRC